MRRWRERGHARGGCICRHAEGRTQRTTPFDERFESDARREYETPPGLRIDRAGGSRRAHRDRTVRESVRRDVAQILRGERREEGKDSGALRTRMRGDEVTHDRSVAAGRSEEAPHAVGIEVVRTRERDRGGGVDEGGRIRGAQAVAAAVAALVLAAVSRERVRGAARDGRHEVERDGGVRTVERCEHEGDGIGGRDIHRREIHHAVVAGPDDQIPQSRAEARLAAGVGARGGEGVELGVVVEAEIHGRV
jgi:hypothetical protein